MSDQKTEAAAPSQEGAAGQQRQQGPSAGVAPALVLPVAKLTTEENGLRKDRLKVLVVNARDQANLAQAQLNFVLSQLPPDEAEKVKKLLQDAKAEAGAPPSASSGMDNKSAQTGTNSQTTSSSSSSSSSSSAAGAGATIKL